MINNDMKDMEAAAGIFRKDVSTAKLEELLRKLYREYYKTELIDIVDTLNEFQGVVVEEVVALPVKEEEVTSLSTSPAVEMEVVDEADNVQLLAVLKKVTDINERTLALVKEINELPKSEKTAPMYDMMVTTIEDNMAALKSIANMVANNSMSSTAGMSAMEESIAKMMSASSKLPTASNNKEDIKLNELVDMIIKMNSTAESFNNQYPKSLAEQLLRSYIEPDSLSRSTPLGNVSIPETISKAGVFAIQRALLSEIFDVRRVTRSYGAALYDGKIIETAADRDSLKNITSPQAKSRIRNERFVQEIEKRFKASGLGQSFDYFILENQQFPDISEEANGGDSLLSLLEGSGPALVVFPKSWVTIPSTTLSTGLPHAKAVQESNVLSKQSSSGLGKSIIFQAQTSPSILSQFSGDRLTRRRLYLPSVALATTLSFALQSSGLFDTITKSIESGQLPSSSAVPSYVLPMLLTSAGIPIVAALVEFVVGKMKQVNMDFTAFPSLTIFNFGLHSTWLNAPKNRSDAFDITISHVLTSLILSFALFWTGLDIMAKDIAEHSINPANYPVIPIPLLQANSLLQQLITIKIPTFFQDVVLSLQATSAATASSDGGAVSNIFSDQMIHIPWQMLVGMTSFIATTFNLLPSNDNQGNKLVFHSLGITGNLAAFVASSVVRFVITIIAIGAIFIPSFRSGNSDLNVIQIAIDYYFLSQFVGTEQVSLSFSFHD